MNTLNSRYGVAVAERVASVAHKWYTAAMTRRRSYTLEKGRFIAHVTGEDVVCFGNLKDGLLFGFEREGAFVVSHYAPRTQRGGVRLIKRAQKELSLAFFIPDDLGVMLEKMGFYTLAQTFPTVFGEEVMVKKLWTNCGLVLDRVMTDIENLYS